MEIVITNDDGWGAPGLECLIKTVAPLGHLTVMVPDGARSGMSNAVSAADPVYLKPQPVPDWMPQDSRVYLTNGTPSDCVKLAINVLFDGDKSKIDLLLSGINHGNNAAINLIYSGTVGATFVGAEHRIPSIAFSIDDLSLDADFSHMSAVIPDLIRHLMDEGIRPGICYNINAPKGPIAGIRWTRQAKCHWEDEMKPAVDENGQTYYHLGGHMVNEEPDAVDTDLYAMAHGLLSVQPCHVDMTHYESL